MPRQNYLKPRTKCVNCPKQVYGSFKHYPHYCSLQCKKESEGNQYISPIKPRECPRCKKFFYPSVANHVACSTECRKILSGYFKTNNFSIFMRDKFKCIYCGKSSIEDGVKLEYEHIIPLSFGGKNELSNIITSCKDCNKHKYTSIMPKEIIDRIAKELSARNEGLSEERLKEVERMISVLGRIYKSKEPNL